MKRSSLKRGNSQLKRSPLKKQSNAYKEKAPERKDRGERIMACFERVKAANIQYGNYGTPYWLSEESGEKIFNISTWNFHHLLYKSTYPEWEDVDENIIILTKKEHSTAHSDLDSMVETKRRTELMKQKTHRN